MNKLAANERQNILTDIEASQMKSCKIMKLHSIGLLTQTTSQEYILSYLLFSAVLKPRGHYLDFWQADLGYIGQAIIGVKVPNSTHVAFIQH